MKKKFNYSKLMILPVTILYGLFFVYPLCKGIGMSFTNWNGISAPKFVGFQNFIDFFHDQRALHDIKTTVLFALGSAPLLNVVGLIYALLMNDSSIKGRTFVRACIYLPAVISPLIMGYIWYLLLQPGRGVFNNLAQFLGHPEWFGNWQSTYSSSMIVLILVNVWQYAGMTMIIYLAGLQNISKEYLEAAKIDGATSWQCFWKVTLPLLMPAIRINVVTNIIGSLGVFDIVMSLTGGGPGYLTETLSIYIMRMCYGAKTGYSTAVALIMFIIVVIPVAISLHFTKSQEA